MHLEVARGKHPAHDLHEDILGNGIEATFFAQPIDEGDVGGMGPDLGEQLEIHRVDSLSVLIEEMVNGEIVSCRRGGVGGGLATGIDGEKKGDCGEEEAGGHRRLSV